MDLLPGLHELLVRAVDTRGQVDPTPAVYTWRIGPPPDTFVNVGPDEVTESNDAAFVFGSNLPGVTFECALDEAVENLFFTPCAQTVTFHNVAFGEHELLVRAVDGAGNVDTTPAEWSWEVGGIPPHVLIESGPDLTTSDRSARFQFSAPGNVVFMCSLDGAQASPCLPGHAYNGLPLGPHVFEVSVLENEFTLEEPPISTWEWTVIDTTGLDTTIIEGPPAVTAGIDPEAGGEATVWFSFTANDPRATFECAVDGEAFDTCENPHLAEGLMLGQHIFRVRAVLLDPNDQTVNVDPTPANWYFTTVEAPDTFIDIGPEGELNGKDAHFAFSSTVSGSTFECALDLGPFAPCDNPYDFTVATDGEHILEVRAVTPYGVVDTTPEEWSWDVNGSLPETQIVSGPALSTTSTSAAFVFTASEPAEFECSLDGGLFEGCEEGPTPLPGQPLINHMLTELTLGTHTLRVRALDETDLFDPTPASYTWTIVPEPQTHITSGPPDTTTDTSATIAFSTTSVATRFECSLDGGTFETCSSPHTYSGLAIGWHWVAVRAVDVAGHVDMSPALHNWTVQRPGDGLPPDTTITLKPPLMTPSTSATFRLSADELGTTFKCSLDGAPFTPCTTRPVYTELPIGPHTFRALATDAAGNVELEPATYTWTITNGDATPPETFITGAPQTVSTSVSASFSFDATETGATFECSLNFKAFEPCSSPKTYLGMPGGDHFFLVRATDGNGNVDPSPAIYEWTVEDVTPPDTQLLETPSDPSNSGTARFAFTGTDNTLVDRGRGRPAHVRVPPRQRRRERLERVRDAADLHEPRSGRAHVRRARGRRRRQRRPDARELRLDGRRRDAARHDGRHRPDGHDPRDERDLRVLRQRSRHLRVPGRLRRLGFVHLAPPGHRARPRNARVRGPRDGLGRPRRCHPGCVHVDDRGAAGQRPAGDGVRHRPAGRDGQHERDVDVLLRRARLHVRLLARRRGLQPVRLPRQPRQPVGRRPPVPRPRHGRRGQHRPDGGGPQLARHAAAGDDDPDRPDRGHREHERDVHVRGRPGRRHVRVRARPGHLVHAVRVGRRVHRPRDR